MKKSMLLLFCLSLALNFTLVGCDNKSKISSNVPITDPFENSDSDNQDNIQHLRYGFGLHGEEADFLDNNIINVPLWLCGDETSVNVGVMFFIDGILQEYSADELNNMSYFNLFDTEVNKESTYQLKTYGKFDRNIERHSISGISILNPNYCLKGDEIFFGNNHKGLSNVTNYIPSEYAINSFAEDIIIEKSNPSVPISSEQEQKYSIRDDMPDTVFLYQSNLNEHTYSLEKNKNKLKLNFAFVSVERGITDYRVSFYKNHERVKFNGNNDYLDVKAEGGKISETNIIIDDVSIGDFLYCIFVPISSTSENSFAFKSESVLVIDSDKNTLIQDNTTEATEENTTLPSDKCENASVLCTFNNKIILSKYAEKGIELCCSSDGVNIDKNIHLTDYDGFITRSTNCGDKLYLAYSEVIDGRVSSYGIILDSDLNKLKSIEIDDFMENNIILSRNLIVATYDKIYYIDSDNKLYSSDWNGQNKALLFDVNGCSDFTGIQISEINKADNYFAFSAISTDGTKKGYYGIIYMNGSYEIFRKDNISPPQTVDNITIWADKHTEPGVLPSGDIVIYRNKIFEIINTENSVESSYPILCSNGIVVTQYTNVVKEQQENKEGAEFTIYENGKIKKIYLSEYLYPSEPQLACLNGKLIITVYDGEQNKTIAKEIGD